MVVNETDSLKGLVEAAVERYDTSIRQLAFKAHEAGFKVTYTTLHQIRSGKYKSIPGEQTLRAIAYLAGVEESVAFTAAGQPVPGPPLADELPPGADNLSPKSRKAVVDMVRVLVDLETGNNEQRTSDPQDATPRTLRAVAPEGDPRPGQKTNASADEENIAVPRFDLAAHPYFETEHEKFERLHGERGEENQDPESDHP